MSDDLQKWRDAEFRRWKDVFPKMSRGEIWKEVDAYVSVKVRQERFAQWKKDLFKTSDAEIWGIVKSHELQEGTDRRVNRLLIGEDLRKISQQLDEIYQRDIMSGKNFVKKRHENCREAIQHWEKQEKRVDTSKPLANVENLQISTLISLKEMEFINLLVNFQIKEGLDKRNHNNLKSDVVLVGVLREMKANTEAIKANTSSSKQVFWAVVAGIILIFFRSIFEVPLKIFWEWVWKMGS